MRTINIPMMQSISTTPTVTPTKEDLQDIQTGKDLYTKFQNSQIPCNSLKDNDFEKIGEYLMEQRFGGNTNAHIQMSNAIKQMMGEQGEKQMHIRLARNTMGCYVGTKGGVGNMMGNWGWGGWQMMGWSGFGILAFLFWLVGFIDLILLGIFLLKQIRRK